MDSSSPDAFERGDADYADHGDSDLGIDRDSDGIQRIKLKTKLLRSGIVKANSVLKEVRQTMVQAGESEAAGLQMPASEGELEPKGTPTFLFEALPKKRWSKEGPKLRARRLRKEAKAKGRKWYFTGEPCKYGHIKDRLVSNGKCRECNRLDSQRANRAGLYR